MVPLTSDQPNVAPNLDPDMVNAWGMALGGFFWIANNGTGVVSIVDAKGGPAFPNGPKVVIEKGITGAVLNPSSTAFMMMPTPGCLAAQFLYASETGKIWAFNAKANPTVQVVVDRSSAGSVYKGLAIIDLAAVTGGKRTGLRLLATDFFNGQVDVFDENFQLISQAPLPTNPNGPPVQNMFVNAAEKAGFAPFNVAVIDGTIYVTYAKQSDDKMDDVKGPGLGAIASFDLDGHFLKVVVDVGGTLDAPWGMAFSANSFCGTTANVLLVGNFGDGRINVIDPVGGRTLGQLADVHANPIVIDGLWSIAFGTKTLGDPNGLYFTAGPDEEAHGLFGRLDTVTK
jgi:uncharacterized protein (TIGR03118 family)